MSCLALAKDNIELAFWPTLDLDSDPVFWKRREQANYLYSAGVQTPLRLM